jgi:hypothetical protein
MIIKENIQIIENIQNIENIQIWFFSEFFFTHSALRE